MATAEVLYCYRCGKHVRRDGGKCWYCSAPTRRVIRPARRCDFCDEEIGPRAIKCPHCGEFLDERRRAEAQAAAQPQQVIYVIDKAVIQGNQPLMLQGGGPIPPQLAGRLTQGTLEAIRTNNPQLIDQSGVRALPAPAPGSPGQEEGEALEVEAQTVPPPAAPRPTGRGDSAPGALPVPKPRGHRPPPGAEEHLPVRRGEPSVPATTEDSPRPLGARVGRGLLRYSGMALSRAGRFALDALKSAPTAEEPQSDAEVVDEEDRYVVCKFCDTEMLRADNYCYHCGVLMRSDSANLDVKIKDAGKPAGWILLLSLVFAAAFTALRMMPQPPETLGGDYLKWGPWILAGASLLLIVTAFFRRRTSWNQILAIVCFVIWLAMAVFSFLR